MIGKKIVFLISLFVVLGFFLGCQSQKVEKKVDNKYLLEKRLKEYWQAVINKNFDKAYELEYPVFRKVVPKTNYIKAGINTKAVYVGAEPVEINLNKNQDEALVKMALLVKFHVPGIKADKIKIQKKEKWIKVNDNWYHVPGANTPAKQERG